ncbi:cation:proton antiporter [Haloglomus irregulare]|jgi:multicomponent Na+:H+ antiporter subunit G|uniref:Cation:proton antiporter n=1 Tax=Haloglomus irregulare TaxID=2234134 RepID=A0A554NE07_9EURY|nr:cation:proton antiporter [Haloglomus irregulare]
MTPTPLAAPDTVVLVAKGGGAPTVGPVRGAVVVGLVAIGAFFLLVGTVGLVRLPDIYNRMHATSKATTIGAASILLANTAYFGPRGAGLVSLVGIVFLFVTAPTGSHMISRAAQRMGVDFVGDVTWPAGDDGVDDPTEADAAEPVDD